MANVGTIPSGRGVYAFVDAQTCSMAAVRHARGLVAGGSGPLTVVLRLPRSWMTFFVQVTAFSCPDDHADLVDLTFKEVARELASPAVPWDFQVLGRAEGLAALRRRIGDDGPVTVIRSAHQDGHLIPMPALGSRAQNERVVPCDRSLLRRTERP